MAGYVGWQGAGSGAGVSLATTAETVVASITGVQTDNIRRRLLLSGVVEVTPGTGATSLALKIRRDNGSGTAIGTAVTVACTASSKVSASIAATDEPGEVAGKTYVLTVTQGAATGNGTCDVALLSALSY
jgi:hypothetical protein